MVRNFFGSFQPIKILLHFWIFEYYFNFGGDPFQILRLYVTIFHERTNEAKLLEKGIKMIFLLAMWKCLRVELPSLRTAGVIKPIKKFAAFLVTQKIVS
jgi:hypothetical protein